MNELKKKMHIVHNEKPLQKSLRVHSARWYSTEIPESGGGGDNTSHYNVASVVSVTTRIILVSTDWLGWAAALGHFTLDAIIILTSSKTSWGIKLQLENNTHELQLLMKKEIRVSNLVFYAQSASIRRAGRNRIERQRPFCLPAGRAPYRWAKPA